MKKSVTITVFRFSNLESGILGFAFGMISSTFFFIPDPTPPKQYPFALWCAVTAIIYLWLKRRTRGARAQRMRRV